MVDAPTHTSGVDISWIASCISALLALFDTGIYALLFQVFSSETLLCSKHRLLLSAAGLGWSLRTLRVGNDLPCIFFRVCGQAVSYGLEQIENENGFQLQFPQHQSLWEWKTAKSSKSF
jgi:hypothetical protein